MKTIRLEDKLTVAVWVYDIDESCIHWANAAGLTFWESDSLDELCSRDFKTFNSDVVQESLLEYKEQLIEGKIISLNWQFSPKGTFKQAYCHFSGFELEDGRTAMLVEALPVDDFAHDFSIVGTLFLSSYSLDGNFISGNPAFVNNFGHKITNLKDTVARLSDLNIIYEELTSFGRFEGDLLTNSLNGIRWNRVTAVTSHSKSKTTKIIFQQYDIHDLKMGEIELTNDVLSDELTGLLNRRGFYKKIDQIQVQKKALALFYIDLDGFKLINDSFGHSVGDQVLKRVAERLKAVLPNHIDSFACRFGGDEFIVGIVLNIDEPHIFFDEELFADSMVSTLSDVYSENTSHPMTISASIGVAQYPSDINVITELVMLADAAMYQAKELGKRRWVKYKPGMERSIRRRSLIAQRLFNAEKNQELMLYYQPIWDLSPNKNCIVSFEALLRWHDDELGWVPAEDIIKVAEEIGVIDNIERWVAGKALQDLTVLRDYINPHVTMAINISGIHLRTPRLPQFLLGIIEESQLKPSDLTVELTESALIADIEDHNHVVRKLVDSGIKISIDDFGTGYSSLAYLHHIPANIVKIDRSFVERIEYDNKTLKHIKKLIEAHGMKALIEGVETQEQQDTLTSFGIFLHQGHFKGKPKPLPFFLKDKSYTLIRESH